MKELATKVVDYFDDENKVWSDDVDGEAEEEPATECLEDSSPSPEMGTDEECHDLDRGLIWTEFETEFRTFHHEPDLQAARVVYSGVAAHKLKGVPAWIMPIAVPGSGKGVILDAMQGLPNVHFVDEVTPQTFISGQINDSATKPDKPASLLHRIGSGVLVVADFSTMLANTADNRGKIMAQLRRIFDGQFRREFGTAANLDEREWRGRITLVAAVTPDIESYRSATQALGERFLSVRWPRANNAALIAMNQDIAAKNTVLRAIIAKLFGSLRDMEPMLPVALQLKIAALSEFTVRARTHVARDGARNVLYQPEAESATRLAQQLAQLAKGSALLASRDAVNDYDYAMVRRVALDCLPSNRRKVIDSLTTGKLISEKFKPATLSYVRGDLELVGVLDDGRLNEEAADLLVQAGFSFPERSRKRQC